MANVSVYNMEGNEVGKIDLSDAIFGVQVNEHLVHMAVVQQLANNRQGTQKAKTRSEVSGGGRKPWRQKGTGHARQGSTRSPQWKGGGVVFAPTPRDYSFKMNKKEKRAAIKSALTSRVQNNKLIVLEELKLDAIKTKELKRVLDNLKVGKALVVTGTIDQNVICSARNLPSVHTSYVAVEAAGEAKEIKSTINVYDIMKYDTVVMTKDAVANIEEVYA
ncbi:MAG: 50S ribosomal protein L4 [Lachnospiraceae bacterium]|nr:50S ribosomal protein L4 [Lachnospiraceae bacterium]